MCNNSMHLFLAQRWRLSLALDFLPVSCINFRLCLPLFYLLLLFQNKNVRFIPGKIFHFFRPESRSPNGHFSNVYFQTSFYFGYMAMFCLGLGLMCGGLGYLGTSLFVHKIYTYVKIDWSSDSTTLDFSDLGVKM